MLTHEPPALSPQPRAARRGEKPAAPRGEIWSPIRVGSWEDVAGKIDVTMVSSPAPLGRPAGSFQPGRKEGRPPGSGALASRSLLRPAASSPASPNVGVSGRVYYRIWGLALSHPGTGVIVLSSQKNPAAASQNPTRSEHSVGTRWLPPPPRRARRVPGAVRWERADLLVGRGWVSALPPTGT